LLPARPMTMPGSPWRCNSLTQRLAPSKDSEEETSKTTMAAAAPR
jgi:hypothetical protein